MKKFIITLIILIIAAGVVFVFGWVQMQIPAEGYAVIFTKTHGYENEVVRPGEFVWRWQRLLPTNMEYHVFNLTTEELTLRVEGDLPSGKTYSDFLSGNPDFSWTIEVFMRLEILPEMLPSLVRDDNILPETLPDYIDTIEMNARNVIYPIIIEYIESPKNYSFTMENFASLEELLRSSLAARFETVIFKDIQLKTVNFPDFDLYRTAKEYYRQLADLEYRIRREETIKSTTASVAISKEIEKLKEYGKVLSDYPVLMDYLKLAGSFDKISGIESVDEAAPVPGEGNL